MTTTRRRATKKVHHERMDYTADGVMIEPGLAVWNYNYRQDRVVGFMYEECGKAWYQTEKGMFDGDRMTTRHPVTGASAETEEDRADEEDGFTFFA